jgi:hypothetical protein
LRFDVRPLNKCRLLALFRLSLPVPVMRNRLRTLLFVFILGMKETPKLEPAQEPTWDD